MLTEFTKIHSQQQLLREAMKALTIAAEASTHALGMLAGDPDFEDDVDEHKGDELGDTSAPEWISLGRFKGRDPSGSLPHEDDEDDDSDTGGDEAEPNFAKPPRAYGAGCEISDTDFGAEEAGEQEQF